MKLRLVVVAWLFGAAPALARGMDATPAPEEDEELAGLMAILTEETAVATRTRMNGDFVPGIVTVLHGDDLEALGVETVWEALALVPGIQTVRDRDGAPSVVVRGIDFPFNSGNVKVLVDSVPLSREAAGINGVVLQLPIQQVERIEVIRGPGSVVYGDFAFMGLVNVVTRRQRTRLAARGGGDDAGSGSVRLSWKGKWEGSLGAAGWKSGDAPLAAPAQGDEKRGFADLTLARGGFSLTAAGIARRADLTNPGAPAPQHWSQTHWAAEARYGRDFAHALRAELKGGIRSNRFETDIAGFSGDVKDLGAELRWEGWRRHSWLVQTGYSFGNIDSASFAPFAPPARPGAPAPPPPPALSLRDKTRDVFSAAVQDRFDVSDRVALTGGARFDRYSDVGRRVTPRLALVWRASERNILKLQYSEGFRAPTFFELYAPDNRPGEPSFEVNGTSELNYVHRRPRTVVRATLFHAKVRDMIFVAGRGRFDNSHHARAYGAELEWEQQLGSKLKAQANASWVDERDDRSLQGTTQPTAPAADWLGNAALLWRARPRTLVTARLVHVGQRHDAAETGGYDLLDVSLTQQALALEGLQLRGGVKNAFDSELRYVAANPGGSTVFSFPGRTFWLQLAWSR